MGEPLTASPPNTRLVPLSALTESSTNPRKQFDQRKLEELAVSVREKGILQPLLVRRIAEDRFEIVAGARRYRAATAAALAEVPVIVRALTDREVFHLQLTENMERDDLTPIEEAEAYGVLRDEGNDIPAIAKIVNRRSSEVAKRLGLLALAKKVREALRSGTLPVGHAELIGRIPDVELQGEALAEILDSQFYSGGDKAIVSAIPFAAAQRIVEEKFMTALSLAVFDPADPELSPLGPCATCQHLSGNNRDLFGDVKGKSICTNPKDFHLKTANHLKRLGEQGYTVLLTPKQVARAFPTTGARQLSREFVDLSGICPDDPKRRTYDELLGKGEKLKTVFALKDNRVWRLYPAKDIRGALAASGHAFAKKRQEKPKAEKAAERSAAQLEEIGRSAVRSALAANLRTVKLTPGGWIDLLLKIAILIEEWRLESVIRRHGVDGTAETFAKNQEKIVGDRIAVMTDAEKRAFLVDLLIGDWFTSPDKAEQTLYKHVLKLAGVDYARVANAAIDQAKQSAADVKQSKRSPIAAKTSR